MNGAMIMMMVQRALPVHCGVVHSNFARKCWRSKRQPLHDERKNVEPKNDAGFHDGDYNRSICCPAQLAFTSCCRVGMAKF
jgi:hypothetical protein